MSIEFPESINHEAGRKEFFDDKKRVLKQKYTEQAKVVYPEVLNEIDAWVDSGGFGAEEIQQKREALKRANYSPELKQALINLYNTAEKTTRLDIETIESMLEDIASGEQTLDEEFS